MGVLAPDPTEDGAYTPTSNSSPQGGGERVGATLTVELERATLVIRPPAL